MNSAENLDSATTIEMSPEAWVFTAFVSILILAALAAPIVSKMKEPDDDDPDFAG